MYRLLIVALFGWRKWSQFEHTEKMKVRQRKFIQYSNHWEFYISSVHEKCVGLNEQHPPKAHVFE